MPDHHPDCGCWECVTAPSDSACGYGEAEDPFPLLDETGGDPRRLPRLSEWLAAGAPMREIPEPAIPGPVVVPPLSSSWPWLACPDCGRRCDEVHTATCAIHDEPGGHDHLKNEGDYFSEADARALIGRRFRATNEYGGVPAGSVGMVSDVYAVDHRRQQFGVDVTWQGIAGGSPLDLERGGRTDGFSRRDLFLVFTGGPNRGRRAMVPLDGPDGGPSHLGW